VGAPVATRGVHPEQGERDEGAVHLHADRTGGFLFTAFYRYLILIGHGRVLSDCNGNRVL
jgi:hypothetical protein